MENRAFITDFFGEACRITGAIQVDDVDKIISLLYRAWENGSQVFICGNGGSASTATHFTCDLAKTTVVDGKKRFRVLCLNDNVPLVSALTNDEGFENLYYEQLKSLYREGDVLICISVHGGAGQDKAGLWSQNLLKAMQYVKDNGGKAIGFSGFDGGPMKDLADACVVVPAESTPQVESFHVVLEHLICSCLRRNIEDSPAA